MERGRSPPRAAADGRRVGDVPPLPTQTRFHFAGDVQNIQRGKVPRISGRSYAIEAELSIPEGGAEGVICAYADFIGGFALWVGDDGRLRHTYSLLGVETYKQVAEKPLPPGDVKVTMLFEIDDPKPGSGGAVTLLVGDEAVGTGRLHQTVPIAFTSYSGMDISRDNGGVVDLEYEDRAPYAFTGTVKGVVFDLAPAHHEAEQDLHGHHQRAAVAAGAAA